MLTAVALSLSFPSWTRIIKDLPGWALVTNHCDPPTVPEAMYRPVWRASEAYVVVLEILDVTDQIGLETGAALDGEWNWKTRNLTFLVFSISFAKPESLIFCLAYAVTPLNFVWKTCA